MTILAVDTDREALAELAEKLSSDYPHDKVEAFFDPLLAVKYSYSNPVDVLYVRVILGVIHGDDVVRLIQGKQACDLLVNYI